jgi:hypothetical protein
MKAVAILQPLVDGYCKYSWFGKQHCEPKSSVCKGIKNAEGHDDDVGVRVGRRIPRAEGNQISKMPQTGGMRDAAFRFEDGSYCKHKRFICVDGRKCDDRPDSQSEVGRRQARETEEGQDRSCYVLEVVSRDNRVCPL